MDKIEREIIIPYHSLENFLDSNSTYKPLNVCSLEHLLGHRCYIRIDIRSKSQRSLISRRFFIETSQENKDNENEKRSGNKVHPHPLELLYPVPD